MTLHWSEFAAVQPDLAGLGEAMLYEVGLGLGFLATVTIAGAPRVHPICPLLADELYAFIVVGPKLADLRRDGRYALHSETFGPPRHDDAFYLTGLAHEIDRPQLRTQLTDQFLAERDLDQPWPGFDAQALVELTIDRALLTLTEPRDGLPAGHTVWRLHAAAS